MSDSTTGGGIPTVNDLWSKVVEDLIMLTFAIGAAGFLGWMLATGFEYTYHEPPPNEFGIELSKPQPKLSIYPFTAILIAGAMLVAGAYLVQGSFGAERSLVQMLGLRKRKHLRRVLKQRGARLPIVALIAVQTTAAVLTLAIAIATAMSVLGHFLGTPRGPVVDYGTFASTMGLTTSYVSNLKILLFEVAQSVPILDLPSAFAIRRPAQSGGAGMRGTLLVFRICVVVLGFSALVRTVEVVRTRD